MKDKTNQLDQTSDWREKAIFDFETKFGMCFQPFGETLDEAKLFIRELLSSQEQRHQREVEKRVAKLGEPLSTYIQWKGTDVCMDWYCENGHHNHIDGYNYYEVVCEFCQKEYKLGDSVSLYQISQSIK